MAIVTEDSVRRKSGDGALGAFEALLFSDTGGLTQFGAKVEILSPGARSSFPHWHESEDEMVYVLEGTLTLIEDGREELIAAGAAAVFPAGEETPHCLENRGDTPARIMVIGTRAPRERVHYPAEDRVLLIERRGDERRWTHLNGAPADPLPDEGAASETPQHEKGGKGDPGT